jgi:hypothetical protein
LSGVGCELLSAYLNQLNIEMNRGQLCDRLDDYKVMCRQWIERNVSIRVSSDQGSESRPPSYGSFTVPVEDLPDMVQYQAGRDGVNIERSAVASALAGAGLPTTNYTLVSSTVMTPCYPS